MNALQFTANLDSEIPMLISALGALSAIITLFWKIINSNHRETKERGDKLEIKLEENNANLIALTKEMGQLRGRVSLAEEIAPKLDEVTRGVNDLSASVLRAIHNPDRHDNT